MALHSQPNPDSFVLKTSYWETTVTEGLSSVTQVGLQVTARVPTASGWQRVLDLPQESE